MQINLSELLTQEGKKREYELNIPMDRFEYQGGVYPILDKSELKVKIVHEKDRMLRVSGEAAFVLEMPCDRCLEDVAVSVPVSFDREISMNLAEQETEDAFDEEQFVCGYDLEVDKLLACEIFANLPMKVLCRTDCKGICRVCGVNLNRETCECEIEDSGDPRMSVIRDIFKNFKEV